MAGLPVFVASVVSNKCFPIADIQPTTVEDVIATVQVVEPKLRLLIGDMVEELSNTPAKV